MLPLPHNVQLSLLIHNPKCPDSLTFPTYLNTLWVCIQKYSNIFLAYSHLVRTKYRYVFSFGVPMLLKV